MATFSGNNVYENVNCYRAPINEDNFFMDVDRGILTVYTLQGNPCSYLIAVQRREESANHIVLKAEDVASFGHFMEAGRNLVKGSLVLVMKRPADNFHDAPEKFKFTLAVEDSAKLLQVIAHIVNM